MDAMEVDEDSKANADNDIIHTTNTTKKDHDDDAAVVDFILEDLIESIGHDMASKLHRHLHTTNHGRSVINQPSTLHDRTSLYPSLEKQDLDAYAVERIIESDPTTTTTNKRNIIEGAFPPPRPASVDMPSHLDIWGRAPPKEPAQLYECPCCKAGVKVNTLRYAAHLDKCLGIGTLSRSASSAQAQYQQQQQQQQQQYQHQQKQLHLSSVANTNATHGKINAAHTTNSPATSDAVHSGMTAATMAGSAASRK